MKFKTEQTKLELEQYKLHLIKEGKLTEGSGRESLSSGETYSKFDTSLKLLPKFNEKDLDTFSPCLSK